MSIFKTKTFIVLAFISLSFGANARVEHDKVLHLSASSAIGFAANTIFDDYHVALASCLVAGVAKETYDEYKYNGFDGEDLTMDAIGCGLGVISSKFLGIKMGLKEVGGSKMLTVGFKF